MSISLSLKIEEVYGQKSNEDKQAQLAGNRSTKIDPEYDKTNQMTIFPSDQSSVCALRTVKDSCLYGQRRLIKPGGYQGGSESSPGAHIILLVLS